MINHKAGGYDPKVAKALGDLGVDPLHKMKKEREERPRVDPRVAAVLERIGVKYPSSEVISEQGTSPLDMPGQQPAVDPKQGQRSGMQPQGKQGSPQGQNNGQEEPQPANAASVKLKKPATSVKTLQDISDKMTEVTSNIKTVDLLVQALSENKSRDNLIETHKETLRGPIKVVVDSIKDLQRLVE